jgi:hypothetical protein
MPAITGDVNNGMRLQQRRTIAATMNNCSNDEQLQQ